jgi:hypothetical protein
MTPEACQLAARQHALIAVSQLARAGMSRRQVKYALEAGILLGVRRGIYRLAGTPPTWEQTVLAAVLAAGAGAVASHSTAAALWALKHSDRHHTGLHVTAPRQLRLSGVVAHKRRLPSTSRASVHGIPVTRPEQTILDIAVTMPAGQLGACVDDADRRGLISRRRLGRLAEASASRNAAVLRGLLADPLPGGPAASEWEHRMDRLWNELGLPPAVRHCKVMTGGRRYEIDRAIPELKIGVEWNGYEHHGGRSAFHYDSERRADLTAEGWHMIDFTYRSSPLRIVRAVLRAVQERSVGPGAR